MYSSYAIYLELGYRHIADWQAYDHMLYLLALCAVYSWPNWRRVLGLVTAFTVGHALTLVVAGLGLLQFPQQLVELFIPLTIIATAMYNIVSLEVGRRRGLLYSVTLIFGLVHGLGFSNYFRSLLFPGQEADLLWQLLFFNLGVELGQLIIVVGILSISYVLQQWFRVPQRSITIGTSVLAIALSVYLIYGML